MNHANQKTEVKNLGQLKLPLAIFGGPYSNLQALKALQQNLTLKGFAPQQIICTGDMIAYCAQPKETVKLLKEWGIHLIKGNVEQQIANDGENCGCNFSEGSLCETLADSWYAFAQTQIDAEDRAWIASLPERLVLHLGDIKAHVLHGGCENISEFIFQSTEAELKLATLERTSSDIVLCGHSGLPFAQGLPNGKAWVNAGAIGMPANDGKPELWYCTLEERNNSRSKHHKADLGSNFHFDASFHHLPYNHNLAALNMRKQSLPEEYAKALETGLWPCMAILPEQEKSRQGAPLQPTSTYLS